MPLAGIFEYRFMQKAFIAGVLLALVIPCIGIIVVLKRLSLIGDALSHTSLAGVAAGLLFNINPVVAAVFACVLATLSIEFIRKKLPKYSELSIAIILSAGIGLAGVLSGMLDSPSNFNSFLFGSIVAISDSEVAIIAALAVSVFLAFIVLYRELFYMAFNERLAKLSGVPVKAAGFAFTVMTAVTVAIASRTVGALIVSSLMVVPVATALQFSQNYKKTLIISVVLAEAFTVAGLILSYYEGLRPGATIVLIGVGVFALTLIVRIIASLVKKRTSGR